MENQQSLILLRFVSFRFLFPSLQYLLQQYLWELQVLELFDSQNLLEQLIINLALFAIKFKLKEQPNEQFQFFSLFKDQPKKNARLQVSFDQQTIYFVLSFNQFKLIHHNLNLRIQIFHFIYFLKELLPLLQTVFYPTQLFNLNLLYQFFPHLLTLNYTPLYYLFHSFQELFSMSPTLSWCELLRHSHQLQAEQNKQTLLNHLNLIINLNFLVLLTIYSLVWKLL